MNIFTHVGQLMMVKIFIHQLRFLESIGKGELEVVDELFRRFLRIIRELVLLQAHVRASEGCVLAWQHEEVGGGAGHQEPDLVLQLGRHVHGDR